MWNNPTPFEHLSICLKLRDKNSNTFMSDLEDWTRNIGFEKWKYLLIIQPYITQNVLSYKASWEFEKTCQKNSLKKAFACSKVRREHTKTSPCLHAYFHYLIFLIIQLSSLRVIVKVTNNLHISSRILLKWLLLILDHSYDQLMIA